MKNEVIFDSLNLKKKTYRTLLANDISQINLVLGPEASGADELRVLDGLPHLQYAGVPAE